MMPGIFETYQKTATVPVGVALSIAFQAYRPHWQRQRFSMAPLLFLGLSGLRRSTGHEQGAVEVATMVYPWMTGSPLMMAAAGMPESEHPYPQPDRQPPQTRAKPVDAAPPVFQSYKMSAEPLHRMQSNSVPKSISATGADSVTPAPSQSQINRVAAKPSALNPGFEALTDQTPGARVGLPEDQLRAQSLSAQQTHDNRSGLPYIAIRPDAVKLRSEQDLIQPAEPRPAKRTVSEEMDVAAAPGVAPFTYTSSRPAAVAGLPKGTAPEQPDAIAAPAAPLAYAVPRPEATLMAVASLQPFFSQAISHSNQSPDDTVVLPKSSIERTRRSSSPVAPHARPPAAAGFPGIDKTAETGPGPLARTPRERLQAVTDIIETVVDRKLSKKLATVQPGVKRTPPVHPAASISKATSGDATHSDPDRLARRLMRTLNGLYRADRFRRGQIR